MTIEETERLLEVIAVAYPQSRFGNPAAAVQAYHMALDDVPYELGNLAVRKLIRSNKFCPVPAEIRSAALDVALPLPDADAAWIEVQGEAKRVGMAPGYRFSRPEIAEAVRIVTWYRICTSDRPDETAREFRATYAAIRKKALETADPAAVWAGTTATAPAIEAAS